MINSILAHNGNICDYNGNCDAADYGENAQNCGTQNFNYNGQTVIVVGDCTGINLSTILPSKFLSYIAIIAIIFFVFLIVKRKNSGARA